MHDLIRNFVTSSPIAAVVYVLLMLAAMSAIGLAAESYGRDGGAEP